MYWIYDIPNWLLFLLMLAVFGGAALRLQSVSTALPGVLWTVVLIGAMVNIGLSYLFWVDNLRLQALLVVAFASSLAMLIFLTTAMDNPFRGEFSVSSDAYQYVLDHVMNRGGK
jgi:hypothetical protein